MVSRLRILGLVRLASRVGSAALLLVAVPAEAACTDVAAPKVDWRRCTLDGGDYAGRKLNGAELRGRCASGARQKQHLNPRLA